MRKVLLLSTAMTLGALNPAQAGGPIAIVEEAEVVAEKPASSGGFLIPLILIAAIAIAVTSGGNDEAPPQPSDRRLKHDVVRVGTSHLGLGIYRYRYAGLDGIWEGVMAQEVEVMHPSAIRALPGGYKAVDYRKLGLTLRQVA